MLEASYPMATCGGRSMLRVLETVIFVVFLVFLTAACAPAAPPSPSPSPPRPAGQPAPTPTERPAAKPTDQPSPRSGALVLSDTERAEVESFYRGKTIRIIVGFAAGGGYDLMARLTQKYLGRYMPGAPSVVVENMPGAGSLTAANHVYTAAPKDGTTIATFSPAVVLDHVLSGGASSTIQFDPARYPWLGSPTVSTNQCMVRVDSGVDSLEKLLGTQSEFIFGATTPANATSVVPAVISYYLNQKVRVVTGYDGVATIKLAVERNEAHGMCGTWQTFRATHKDWLDSKFGKVVLKVRDDPEGELKDVPVLDRYLNEEARQVLALGDAPNAAGFAWAAPPGIPEVRLKALRVALIEVWSDRDFKAEAERAQAVAIPIDYRALEGIFGQMVKVSPQLVARAKEVLGVK